MIDIRARRMELNLTAKEVAEKVNVAEATVCRWETGNIDNMKRDKIAALANVLQISPVDLIFDSEPNAPFAIGSMTVEEIALLQNYRKLTKENQKAVFTLIESMAK